MKKDSLTSKADQLWESFDEKETTDFWQVYEQLLAQGKDSRDFTIQSTQPKEMDQDMLLTPFQETLYSTNVYNQHFLAWLVLAKAFVKKYKLALIVVAAIVSFSLYFASGFIQSNESVRKEKWLYALFNPQEREIFNYLMNKDTVFIGYTNRGKKIEYLIYKFNLIDWSKKPINLTAENKKVYQLMAPGDTLIHYTKLPSGKYRKIIMVNGKTFLQTNAQKLKKISPKDHRVYQARLSLQYKGKPVRVRQDDFRNTLYNYRQDIWSNKKAPIGDNIKYVHFADEFSMESITSNAWIDVVLTTQISASFRPMIIK